MNDILYLDLNKIKEMIEHTSGVLYVKDYRNNDESYILNQFAVFNLLNEAFKMGLQNGIKKSN